MTDASFVGSIPQHYDSGLGPIIFVDPALDLARRVATVVANDVLETAAGTGILTQALRDALPEATRIVATDLNPPMLEIARKKFGVGDNVEFATADATALPFDDASFDVVACQFGVMFFPEQDKSYREVKRVLRRGGRYLFNVWDTHKHNHFGLISHETVGRFFPSDPPQFQRLPFSYTFDMGKELLISAGFSDIEVAVLRFNKPIPQPELLARGIIFGSPLIDQIKTRGGVDPVAVFDALVLEYRQAFPDGMMSLQALVFSGTKS